MIWGPQGATLAIMLAVGAAALAGPGQALIWVLAGGCVLGMDGEALRYNCHDSLYSPPFYAIADGAHPLWQLLLQEELDQVGCGGKE